MRLRLLITLALLLTAPGGGRVAGGREFSLPASPAAPDAIERLEAWVGAVEAHTPDQLDEPARLIVSWPRPVLDEIFRYQKAFLVVVNGPDGVELARLRQAFGETDLERMLRLARTSGLYQDGSRFIKHATLLHTDIAILAPHSGDMVVPFVDPARRRRPEPQTDGLPRRIAGLSLDGRQLGDQVTGAHWDIARAMLDGLKPSPGADGEARLWYQAINAFMADAHLLADQGVHLKRGREIFPTDPVLLLATGCHFETYSAPRIQVVVQAEASRASIPYAVGDAARNRELARTWLVQALAADPALVEARLHLGNVLGEEGRHAEAVAELTQAVGAEEPILKYFATLILGREQEALGHFAAAQESYERASALSPRAQSPYLALSQLAERQGIRADALKAAQRVLALPAYETARVDPWWSYYDGDGRRATSLLASMRRAFSARERR